MESKPHKDDIHIIVMPIVWKEPSEGLDAKTLKANQVIMDAARLDISETLYAGYTLLAAVSMQTPENVSIVYTFYLEPDED